MVMRKLFEAKMNGWWFECMDGGDGHTTLYLLKIIYPYTVMSKFYAI